MVRTIGIVPPGAKESRHQAAWFEWAKLIPVHLGRTLADFSFAVPNGSMLAGSADQRARLMAAMKRQGLKKGVSDIVIALPRGPYHGAYMELKCDKASKITDEQKIWVDLMNSVGYYAAIVIGIDQAIAFAKDYLKS